MVHFRTLFSLSLLVQVLLFVSCKIHVAQPDSFREAVKKITGNTYIPHKISNFGFVDYQANSHIRVFSWPNLQDPCSIGNLNSGDYVNLYSKKTNGKKYGFLLEQSENCSIAAQAIEAKKIGASMCFSYLNDDSEPEAFVALHTVKGNFS